MEAFAGQKVMRVRSLELPAHTVSALVNTAVSCLPPEAFPGTPFPQFAGSRLRGVVCKPPVPEGSTPPIPLCAQLGLGIPGG